MQSAQVKLEEIATSYRQSCLLFGALELGIFDRLVSSETPSSIAELSDFLGLQDYKTRTLVNCLLQMNLLELTSDGKVAAAAVWSEVKDQNAIAGLINYRDEFEEWIKLADLFRNGQKVSREYGTFNSDHIDSYLDMVKMSNYVRTEALASLLIDQLGTINSILDVGGGHGLYSQRLLERNDTAYASLFDLPPAIAYARRTLPDAIMQHVSLIEGDARELEIEPRFELTMINDLLHSFGHADKRKIVENAVRATQSGGWICIGKYQMSDSSPGAPGNNNIFSAKMILNSKEGYLESNEEVLELLAECGVTGAEVHSIKHDIPSVAVLGRVA
ncbi:class I SAM-dependent methyltransferase [Epibacterium ulvae]|uniref:class I SAM-dependent methyltransferase n=1 Tax=Epibacterium ulvae TaxID=1156985 RepID=UPI00249030E4|nr:class I SAM-dependent methyltransferase [Epibacterium ulvae]